MAEDRVARRVETRELADRFAGRSAGDELFSSLNDAADQYAAVI
jgi:hypothetical protein